MRILSSAALIGVLALSACIDVDMTAEITGPDQAQLHGYMAIERAMVDMMGGAQAFCPTEEGGTLVMSETEVRCNILTEGTFAEVFQGEPGEPVPTITDLGDGTARVSFPIGAMGADTAEMREDPQAAAMLLPMLEGHSFTIRVAGAEIVETNGELSPDLRSASFTFPLVEVLNPDMELPEAFETIVRY